MIDFNFVSVEEFNSKVESHQFIEYNTYNNDFYGTTFESIIPLLGSSKNIIKIIEVNGVKKLIDSCVIPREQIKSIFITTSQRSDREKRLIEREDNLSFEDINKRLKIGDDELSFFNDNRKYFDYTIVNSHLQNSFSLFENIVLSHAGKYQKL